MSTPTHSDGKHPEALSYSSPGCTCPRCNGPTIRVPRRLVDLIMSAFVAVGRFRRKSEGCGWEGNVRVKRHPILVRGPW